MEIKILCPCGAKFKFEVEPVNGHSPGIVHCPACGRDSTDATNALIRQQLSASQSSPQPAPNSATAASAVKVGIPAIRIPAAPSPAASSAPAPSAAMHVSAPTASASAPSASISPKMAVMPVPDSTKTLSVKPPGEAAVHAAPPSSAPANAAGDPNAPGSPKMAFMPAPAAGSGASLSVAGGHGGKKEDKPADAATAVAPEPARAHPAAAKMAKPTAAPGVIRLKRGYVGAIIGAIIGMAIWYFTVITTGFEMKWLAILVGICTGWGARLMGGGKHAKLATAAGFAAVAAILIAQFLAIQFIIAEFVDEQVQQSYKDRIALARDAAAAKTDKDIRDVMAKDEKAGFDEKSPDSISDDDLAKYRGKELVALQKFANGSPSRTQYEAQVRKEIEENGDAKYHFRILTLLWIAAGVTAAWKIVKPPDAA